MEEELHDIMEGEAPEEDEDFGEVGEGEVVIVSEVNEVLQEEMAKAPKKQEALEEKKVIEAALFISAKPLTAFELGKLIGVAAPGFVDAKIQELNQGYEKIGSSLLISKETAGYIMRVKPSYADAVAPLAKESEISKGALKMLAYISKHEGIKQSDMVKRLGSTVYQYVKELVEKDFVEKKRQGRTSVLHTTQKFKEYFQS